MLLRLVRLAGPAVKQGGRVRKRQGHAQRAAAIGAGLEPDCAVGLGRAFSQPCQAKAVRYSPSIWPASVVVYGQAHSWCCCSFPMGLLNL